MAHRPDHRRRKIGNPWYGFKRPEEYDEDQISDRERAALALRYQNEVGWPEYPNETFGLFNTPGNIPSGVEDVRRKALVESLYNAKKLGVLPEDLQKVDLEELKKWHVKKSRPDWVNQTTKFWGDAWEETGGAKAIAQATLDQFRPKKDDKPAPKTDATSSSTDTSVPTKRDPITIDITGYSQESVKKQDHLKTIWGQFADDPKERKKMYLSQLNKIYAKSMLLDGWASITGGESRAPQYTQSANDILEKTAKFDAEIRLHEMWQVAMFKDGKYFPAKTQADLYERFKAIGARPDEIEYFMKGFGGKEFRDQKDFDAGYKQINIYDKETSETRTVDLNDPKTRHMFKIGRWVEATKESGSSYAGKKFAGKISVLGKRFRKSDDVEVKRQVIADAIQLIKLELMSDKDNSTRMAWKRAYPDEVEALTQPNGIENLARKMMGIALPAGNTGASL